MVIILFLVLIAVISLDKDWRVCSGLVGALPRYPRQNTQHGLPLKLSHEETTLLLEKGMIIPTTNINMVLSCTNRLSRPCTKSFSYALLYCSIVTVPKLHCMSEHTPVGVLELLEYTPHKHTDKDMVSFQQNRLHEFEQQV